MNASERTPGSADRLGHGRGWQTPVFLCSAAVVVAFVFAVEGLGVSRLLGLAVAAAAFIALWLVATTRRVVPRGGNKLMTIAWTLTGILYVLAVAPLGTVVLRGLDGELALASWGAVSLAVAAPLLVAAVLARPRRR